MINTCFQCGLYESDKVINPDGPFAICSHCGYLHPFLRLPLLAVGGASGSGKSTVCNLLAGKIEEAVLLDCDILWREEFNTPENNYQDFFETWLRIGKNISQSGRPVVLFGAGFAVPENLESCIERRYFTEIYYLALVCSGEKLERRLRQRPMWRNTRSKEFIASQINFNQWFKDYGKKSLQPMVTLVDTTNETVEQTAAKAEAWIHQRVAGL